MFFCLSAFFVWSVIGFWIDCTSIHLPLQFCWNHCLAWIDLTTLCRVFCCCALNLGNNSIYMMNTDRAHWQISNKLVPETVFATNTYTLLTVNYLFKCGVIQLLWYSNSTDNVHNKFKWIALLVHLHILFSRFSRYCDWHDYFYHCYELAIVLHHTKKPPINQFSMHWLNWFSKTKRWFYKT